MYGGAIPIKISLSIFGVSLLLVLSNKFLPGDNGEELFTDVFSALGGNGGRLLNDIILIAIGEFVDGERHKLLVADTSNLDVSIVLTKAKTIRILI